MDVTDFQSRLKLDGYREIATQTMEARPANGDHAHEFSIRGLVTAGEFIITSDGVPRSYTAGQVFEVAAGQMHNESVGPQGTCVTTGRFY